jgi:hypothetical protein
VSSVERSSRRSAVALVWAGRIEGGGDGGLCVSVWAADGRREGVWCA